MHVWAYNSWQHLEECSLAHPSYTWETGQKVTMVPLTKVICTKVDHEHKSVTFVYEPVMEDE